MVSSIIPPYYGPVDLTVDNTFHFEVEFLGKEPCGKEKKVFDGSFNLLADGELLTYKPVEITVPPCNKKGCINPKYEVALEKEVKEKHFKVYSENSSLCKEKECCRILEFPEIKPCFTLHWGDSKNDKLETHDTEVVYITAHNPISGVKFNNFIIEKLTVIPKQSLPNGEDSFEIVPDSLICFGNIDPCGHAIRKFAFHLRNAKPRSYTIHFDYKICGIELVDMDAGSDSFTVELVDS